MFNNMLRAVEKKYTTIKYFCFPIVIKTHWRKLVVKKKGRDSKRILNGTTDKTKSFLIKLKSGDANQKGIATTIDVIKNTKKYL